MLKVYLESDNVIELRELKDGATGASVEHAQVLCTLMSTSKVALPDVQWPIEMTSVGGGTYRATIPHVALSKIGLLIAKVTADAGPGLFRTWYASVRVVSG